MGRCDPALALRVRVDRSQGAGWTRHRTCANAGERARTDRDTAVRLKPAPDPALQSAQRRSHSHLTANSDSAEH
jgi:hypothetical protein